jgi:hypothetical protein
LPRASGERTGNRVLGLLCCALLASSEYRQNNWNWASWGMAPESLPHKWRNKWMSLQTLIQKHQTGTPNSSKFTNYNHNKRLTFEYALC